MQRGERNGDVPRLAPFVVAERTVCLDENVFRFEVGDQVALLEDRVGFNLVDRRDDFRAVRATLGGSANSKVLLLQYSFGLGSFGLV